MSTDYHGNPPLQIFNFHGDNALPAIATTSPMTSARVANSQNLTLRIRKSCGMDATAKRRTPDLISRRIASLNSSTGVIKKSLIELFNGPVNVYPLVMLSSSTMRTHYGFRGAPSFEIVGWKSFGASPAPVLAPPVAPLTAGEITSDSIDDFSPAPKDETIGKVKKPFERPPTMMEDPSDSIPF
jgi:hypothetical protein